MYAAYPSAAEGPAISRHHVQTADRAITPLSPLPWLPSRSDMTPGAMLDTTAHVVERMHTHLSTVTSQLEDLRKFNIALRGELGSTSSPTSLSQRVSDMERQHGDKVKEIEAFLEQIVHDMECVKDRVSKIEHRVNKLENTCASSSSVGSEVISVE